jgi:OOP family OmpA-OmpF porin
VPDTADICPATPGFNGGDKPGCPRKASSVIVTPKEIRITQQIQFALDSHIIRPISFKILDEVRDVLRENPSFRIEVQGHTDNLGPAAYNKGLSQRRAESVMQYLRKGGIDPARMTAVGYGMERPLVPNDSAKNREQNRRVQFIRQESTAGR